MMRIRNRNGHKGRRRNAPPISLRHIIGIIPVLLLVVVVVACCSSPGRWVVSAQQMGDDGGGGGVSCAADVRRCPDGSSFVSRDPTAGCDFEACPDGETAAIPPPAISEPERQPCTEDATICPDGTTTVSRDPDDGCDFFPCPDGETTAADVRIELVPLATLGDEMSGASFDESDTMLLGVRNPHTVGVDCTTVTARAPLETVCRGDVDLDLAGEEEEEDLEEGSSTERRIEFELLAAPEGGQELEVYPLPDGTVQIELLLRLVQENENDVPCSSKMQFVSGGEFDDLRLWGADVGMVNKTASFVDLGTCEVSTKVVINTSGDGGPAPANPKPIRLGGASWSVSYDTSALANSGGARTYRYDTESYTWVRGTNPRLVDVRGDGVGGGGGDGDGSGGDDVNGGGDDSSSVVVRPPRPPGVGESAPTPIPPGSSSSSSALVDCYDEEEEFAPPPKEEGVVDVYLIPADEKTFGDASNFDSDDRMLFRVLHPPPPPTEGEDDDGGGVTCGTFNSNQPDDVECRGYTALDLSSNSVFRVTFLSPCGFDIGIDATTGKAFFEFLVERRVVEDGGDRGDEAGGGVDYATSNQILWGGSDFVPTVRYGPSSGTTPTSTPMELSAVSFFEIGDNKIFTRAEFDDPRGRDDIRVRSISWNVTYDPMEVGLSHDGVQSFEYSTANRLWIRAYGVDLVPTVEVGSEGDGGGGDDLTGVDTDAEPGGGDRDDDGDSKGGDGPSPIEFDLVPAGSEYSTSESYRGSPDFLLFAFPSPSHTPSGENATNNNNGTSSGAAAANTTGEDDAEVECVTIQPFMETVCERRASFDLSSSDSLAFNFSRPRGYVVEMDGAAATSAPSAGGDVGGGTTVSFEFRLYRLVDATSIGDGQDLVCRDGQTIRGGSDGFVPTLLADDRSQPLTFREEDSFVGFDTCGLTAVVVYDAAPKQREPAPSKPKPPAMLRNGGNASVPVDVSNATTIIQRDEDNDKIRFQSLSFTVRYDPGSAPGGTNTYRYTTDSGTGMHASNVDLVPIPCVVDCGEGGGNGTAAGGAEDDPPPTFGFAPVAGDGETSSASAMSPMLGLVVGGGTMAALLLFGGMLSS